MCQRGQEQPSHFFAAETLPGYNICMKTSESFAKIILLDCAVFESSALFDAVFEKMNEERQRKILSLRRAEDRRTSLGAGYLAAKLTEECSPQWRVLHDQSGRPLILDAAGGPAPVHLSLSHSGTFAMAGLSNAPIGVDIERGGDVRMEIVDRFFAENEKAYLRQAADKPRVFYEIWCKKECRIKTEGFRDLRELPVLPAPDGTVFHEYAVEGYSCFALTRADLSPDFKIITI